MKIKKIFQLSMIVVTIPLFVAWIFQKPELVVYINMIIGFACLTIVCYMYMGLQFISHINNIRNADYDYRGRLQVMGKLIVFALPNLVVGFIINEMYGIWPWS